MEQEDWKEWLLHPVTIEFRKAMKNRMEEMKNDWVEGLYTAETVDQTAQKNAAAIGRIQQLADLLDATYEGITEDAANGK